MSDRRDGGELKSAGFFGYESWPDATGDFLDSAGQIVEGSLIATNQVNFRLAVENILSQLEEGKTTITRPSFIEDNAVFFPDLTKFLDYFFEGKDTTSVDNFFNDSAFFTTALNVVQETGLDKDFETAFTQRLQNNIDTYFENNPLQDENAEDTSETGPTQSQITGKAGQRVYDKEGNVVGIKYDNVTYSQDESGQWVSKEQPVADTESEYSVTQAEATIDGLRVRDINYVKDVFAQRGYEATPEEIKNILTTSRINELEGASEGSLEMVLSGEVGTYVNENTVNVKDLNRIFKEELGRRPTDEEVKQILGEEGNRGVVQGPEDFVYDFITEATSLPEESTSVLDLSVDQVKKNWGTIKESLGQISSAVGKIIFGPDGMPTNVDEWLDWVDKTLKAKTGPGTLPWEQSPLVITTAPGKGTWLDLKIPVNFEVNGNPIRIPLFDEDGNFVGSENIKNAVVNAAGEVLGPLGEIGSILTDGDGNLIADIKDIGNVLLDDLTLNEDGSITGSSTATVLLGDLFFNEDGTWEEVAEVVDINADSTADDDGLGNTTDNDGLGLTNNDDDDDDTQPAPKPPAGRLITDQDGNIISVAGADGNTYILSEDGSSWEVLSDGLDDDTNTSDLGDDIRRQEIEGGTSGEFQDPEEVIIDDDGTNTSDLGDDIRRQEIEGGTSGEFQDPEEVIIDDDEEVIIDDDDDPDTPEEPPLQGPPGEPGEPGAPGAAGAAGRNATSGGYMGGISYQLPQFVGVQYQPKDYTVELDRIINESLFKGMI